MIRFKQFVSELNVGTAAKGAEEVGSVISKWLQAASKETGALRAAEGEVSAVTRVAPATPTRVVPLKPSISPLPSENPLAVPRKAPAIEPATFPAPGTKPLTAPQKPTVTEPSTLPTNIPRPDIRPKTDTEAEIPEVITKPLPKIDTSTNTARPSRGRTIPPGQEVTGGGKGRGTPWNGSLPVIDTGRIKIVHDSSFYYNKR